MNPNNSTDKKIIEVKSQIKHIYRTVSAIEDQLKLIKDMQLEATRQIHTITHHMMKMQTLQAMRYERDYPEDRLKNNS